MYFCECLAGRKGIIKNQRYLRLRCQQMQHQGRGVSPYTVHKGRSDQMRSPLDIRGGGFQTYVVFGCSPCLTQSLLWKIILLMGKS